MWYLLLMGGIKYLLFTGNNRCLLVVGNVWYLLLMGGIKYLLFTGNNRCLLAMGNELYFVDDG